MQRNPERLVMSLRCPYTWLAGVTHPAPGGLDMRLNNLALYLQLRIGGKPFSRDVVKRGSHGSRIRGGSRGSHKTVTR